MEASGTPNHRDAEWRMREIVRNADLPEPDEVRYEFNADEGVFMWNEQKLAVVIDLDDAGTGEIELRSHGESVRTPR